jgi:protoheme IX farnesyltransferase
VDDARAVDDAEAAVPGYSRAAGPPGARLMRRIRILAVAATVSTGVLIGWGGLVRSTGSGDGCPDWPKCFGRWIPPLEYHALIEYTHRSLALASGALIVALSVTVLARLRDRPELVWPAVLVLPLYILQAALGAVVVRTDLDPGWVTVHFAVAMITLAVPVWMLVAALTDGRRGAGDHRFERLAAGTALAAFGLLLVGTYVRAENAGVVFRDWPLMDGRLVPALGGAATLMFAHRILAGAVLLLVLWLVIRVRTVPGRPRDLVVLATAAGGLYVAQVAVGAANVLTRLDVWARATHVALSAAIWAVLVALVAAARWARVPETELVRSNGHAARPWRQRVAAYFALTKPRIIELLLITTVPAMILAERGLPPLRLVAATLLGGATAAGAANAINCYLDRDIDEVMRRTRRRPLPAGEVAPEDALRFGYVLGAASFFFLAIAVNVLAASLAVSAIAFYVFVYTLWLKRRSTQNIVIGGAAGAVPALVGWAAVTGTVGLPAWVLFAIVFVWTPPHFWALAMQYRADYRAAGVPMLPVVRGEEETRRQILGYSLVLFAASMTLVPLAHMGPLYTATAAILGGLFVHRALRLWRERSAALALGLFRFSIVYLGLLFAAVAADGVLAR